VVQVTLTTADDNLCRIVEPQVCVTSRRIEVLKIMQHEGIPTVVWITPLLPHITGTVENVRSLVNSCIASGVRGIILFGAGLTLRDGDRQYYYKKLDEHFPGMKEQYIREFGEAYELPCEQSGAIMRMVRDECHANHINMDGEVFSYMHEFPETPSPKQMELF
jgi:DNA repair photolyase